MISHPVQRRVQEVNRQVRRATLIYAAASSLFCVLSVALLVGLADFLLRFEDPGIRLINSGLVLVVAIWSFYRFLWPGWGYRLSDLQVAQWIEQRFPQVQNRLSSGLAFVSQSEQGEPYGSTDLRRAVVAQATEDLKTLDLSCCVDSSRARRVAVMASLVCLLVLILAWIDPVSSSLAARRLALPWQSSPWPRRNELVFVDPPERLAVGADFEAVLVDLRGDLPDTVQIQYWFDDTSEAEIQTKSMQLLNDRMVHRSENVQRSFRYRASGGDDTSMEWRYLQVVPTPQVDSLRLRLFPPEYTGWSDETSGENIVALQGTTIGVSGRLDQPVAAVDLRVVPREAQEEIVYRMQVSQDGRMFRLPPDDSQPWVVEDSGRYWLEVTDLQGLRGIGGGPWNLRVVPDVPPAVSLEKPGANTYVTASAVVPIKATVKDDLAIQGIGVRWQRGDQPDVQPHTMSLYQGPDPLPASAHGNLMVSGEQGDTQAIDTDWDLSAITDLVPGIWIELQMVAADYKPQFGFSSIRRLTIISDEELEERLAARQAYLLGQLREVLRMQQDTRARVRSLEIEFEETGTVDHQDVDQLQSAELNQRQIGHKLDDPADGVAVQITAVLDELQTNRVDHPETLRRMTELLSVIQHINQQHLPEIQRQMLHGLRLARTAVRSETPDQQTPPDIDSLRQSLAAVGTQQDQVIEILEALLGELSQWDNYRRFAREISRMRREQQALTDQTEQLRLDTLGQRLEDLLPQQKAALRRQAQRQTELARRLEKMLSRMEQVRGELVETEPLAAEMLADALDLARQAAISGQMHQSGRQIEANQVGQAVDTQRSVESDLSELIDVLANRREQELDRRLQGLDQAGPEIERLRQELGSLLSQLDQAQQIPDPDERHRELQRVAPQAESLAEQTERLGRRLQRLQAEPTARLLNRAAAEMRRSAEAGEQDRASESLQQAQQADQTMQEAEQQLQADRQQAAQELLQETMARLEQQIKALISRQENLLQATAALSLPPSDQQPERPDVDPASIRKLAQVQQELSDQTAELAAATVQSRVFAEGLQGAATEMQYAAQSLQRAEAHTMTQRYQRQAITRLLALVQALQQEPPTQDTTADSDQMDNDASDPPSEDLLQRLAELKLLRLLQIEVNRQTAELADKLDKHDPDHDHEPQMEAALRRLEELAIEQGRLADFVLEMSQEIFQRSHDSPEGSPE